MFPGGIPSRAREDVAWEHTHGDIGVVCHTDDLDAAAPSPGSGEGATTRSFYTWCFPAGSRAGLGKTSLGNTPGDVGVAYHTDDLDGPSSRVVSCFRWTTGCAGGFKRRERTAMLAEGHLRGLVPSRRKRPGTGR